MIELLNGLGIIAIFAGCIINFGINGLLLGIGVTLLDLSFILWAQSNDT